MVSLFSRFSAKGNRRTQSVLDRREVEANGAAATTQTSHGIEVAIEFEPIEHPIEPLDCDTLIQCPLPEPSILNDGTIWKNRASANARRRADQAIVKDGEVEPRSGTNEQTTTLETKTHILPSISAPEHSLLKLLEE